MMSKPEIRQRDSLGDYADRGLERSIDLDGKKPVASEEYSQSVQTLQLLSRAIRVALGLSTNFPLCADRLNLDVLFSLSDSHGILPYLFEYLKFQGVFHQHPPEVAERWRQKTDLYRSHYYWKRAHWLEVKQRFESAEVDFTPLKGVATAFSLYPKPFRLMSDFDVLIRVEELLAAHRALEKAGFEPLVPKSRFRWHEPLQRCALRQGAVLNSRIGRTTYCWKGEEIDLHWMPRYCPPDFPWEFDNQILWRNASQVRGHQWELSPSDHFLLVLIHAVFSQKLVHWIDVFLLLKTLPKEKTPKQLLLNSKAFSASTQLRLWMAEQFRAMEAFIFSAGLPRYEQLQQWPWYWIMDPDYPINCFEVANNAVPTLSSYLRQRCEEMVDLTLLQRILFLMGFVLPNWSYYPKESCVRAVFCFYGAFVAGVARMGVRVAQFFAVKFRSKFSAISL